MAQPIKPPTPYSISQEMIEQYLLRQSRVNFVRSLSDNLESDMFTPNSSLRLWYNDTMTSYAPHWHSAYEMIADVEGELSGHRVRPDLRAGPRGHFSDSQWRISLPYRSHQRGAVHLPV